MLGATLLWGGTFVVIRDSLHRVDPIELVAARFTVATAGFAILLVVLRRRPDAVAWRGGIVAGLCAAFAFAFQAIGLTATSAGSSAFLTCVGTALAAFFAWPMLGQRPSGALLQGLLLALAGSALLGSPGTRGVGRGEAWTLLAAALYALQIVALARVAPRTDPVALAAVQAATIAVLGLPWTVRAAGHAAALDAATWWRFAYLALPASLLAPLLQILAQRALPAGRIALLFALEPVFALLFAVTLGGERYAWPWWLGAALILCGVLRVEAPALSDARPSSSPASG